MDFFRSFTATLSFFPFLANSEKLELQSAKRGQAAAPIQAKGGEILLFRIVRGRGQWKKKYSRGRNFQEMGVGFILHRLEKEGICAFLYA